MSTRETTARTHWGLLFLAFVVLCVANGRWPWAPAAWIAPMLLLSFVQLHSARRGLALAFAVQLVAFFVSWQGMIPVPGIWYFVVAGTYATVYFLPYVLHRILAPSIPGFLSTLVFPISWVAIEFVFQQWITPYASWVSLAYTQVRFLSLMQLVSITGLAGVHFVMTWTAAIAVWAREQGARRKMVRSRLTAYGALVLTILFWGGWRVHSMDTGADRIGVSMLTPSAAMTAEFYKQLRILGNDSTSGAVDMHDLAEAADRLNRDLLERTLVEAESGADLIVWSEHAARVTRRTEESLIDDAREIARSFDVDLILGIGLWDPEASPSFENKLALIDASGTVQGTYFKARPIVGQESGTIERGSDRVAVLESEHGRFAAVICHDLDFPDFVREAGRHEVRILAGPSSDWEAISSMHASMALPRAIETGSTLVRPTEAGVSLVVDPVGRVVASQLDRGSEGNVLRASVSLLRARTLYPIVGDAFAWANLAGLILLLSVPLLRLLKDGRVVAAPARIQDRA